MAYPQPYKLGSVRTDRGEFKDAGNQVFDVTYEGFGNRGAKLNGSDDDTLAFRDACAAASAEAGGVVYVPDGVLKTTDVVTCKSHVQVRGSGPEVAKIYHANESTANCLHFTDTTTGNGEHRFAGIDGLWMYGNNTGTGALVKVDNPYQWKAHWCRMERHGGRGLDIQKGANSSTYGQNVWVDYCWIQTCLSGGLRMYKQGGGSSVDIAKISNSAVNGCGKYGIYLQQVVICSIDTVELSGYEYGAAVSGNQSIPIVLNGGNNVRLDNNSFEGNGGNGATPNYNVRTGWDGDAQSAASNDTQVLLFKNNDFKPAFAPGGALTHVKLKNIRSVLFDSNFFEGDVAHPNDINGVDFDSGSASLGAYTFLNNRWGTVTNKFTGSARAMLMLEVPYGLKNDAAGAIPGIGYLATDLPEVWARSMFTGESYDRFQILGGGTIARGLGAAAPGVIFAVGAGTPEGAITGEVGSIYQRTNGGANTSMYVKESGSGNTGWVAK